MKTVVRYGVFETNSSSSHTLMLMSKDELEADRNSENPKTGKFNTLSSKRDKLYLACGCCYEMFPEEDGFLAYNCEDDADRKVYFAIKNHEKILVEMTPEEERNKYGRYTQRGENLYERYFVGDEFSSEVATEYIVRVYCNLTGEDYNSVLKEVSEVNDSGRACHMKFFCDGALDDASWDYRLIYDLFYGTVDEIEASIKEYFDDNFVVCYREYY